MNLYLGEWQLGGVVGIGTKVCSSGVSAERWWLWGEGELEFLGFGLSFGESSLYVVHCKLLSLLAKAGYKLNI